MMHSDEHSTPIVEAFDCYARPGDGQLIFDLCGEKVARGLAESVHDQFRAYVLTRDYPCVGAKSVIEGGHYRFGFFPALGSADAASVLHRAIERFVADQDSMNTRFSTFIASFDGPALLDEAGFESALWAQLSNIDTIDAERYAWDPTVSSDPGDKTFSFSIAGRAFFIIGLSPVASRYSRRFGWPTLVFNAHAMFEDLRDRNQLERWKTIIRDRDTALQGGIPNHVLADFGESSEARQYSGRATDSSWKCPFMASPRPVES